MQKVRHGVRIYKCDHYIQFFLDDIYLCFGYLVGSENSDIINAKKTE